MEQTRHATRQAGAQQVLSGDAFHLGEDEDHALDDTLLREIETELAAVTGCQRKDRVRITVARSVADFQRFVRQHVPRRAQQRGIAAHIRVVRDSTDPHHLIVGPSALAGLNDGHSTVITDLVYMMIEAAGQPASLAFDRGASDILAAELARRMNLDILTDFYPAERRFAEAVIEAVKGVDQDPIELVALLKRSPRQFFKEVRESGFYKWWAGEVKQDANFSQYVDLTASLASPNAQMEGSFMEWAAQCAGVYRDYRAQQRQNALAGAAKRAESS